MVVEVTEISHRYGLSLKELTWGTMLIIVVMAALYALVGLPPGLDTYYAKMYFHSIGIGMAALGTYIVIICCDLKIHEPPLDFPIHYRAFAAVLFAAAGGVFYLSPVLDMAVPDIPLGLFVVAFILIGDVGGALFILLMLLPRKRAGTYDPNAKTTRLEAAEWSKKAEKLGAGELLVTSIDRDGTKLGYDLELLQHITSQVSIPVIASGGCGSLMDFGLVFSGTGCDAALVASLFHYGELSIKEVKDYLTENGVLVRP